MAVAVPGVEAHVDVTSYLPNSSVRLLVVADTPAPNAPDPAVPAAIAAGHDIVRITPDLWAANSSNRFDAIVLDRVLPGFADLPGLFAAAHAMLQPGPSRLVVLEHVDETAEAFRRVGGHSLCDLSNAYHGAGFHVRRQKRSDPIELMTLAEMASHNRAHPSNAAAAHTPTASHTRTAAHEPATELWDLRPGTVQVRSYRPGDEAAILDAFQEIFQDRRSMEHWKWKFAQCPFGGPWATVAWDGPVVVGHYAGYPIPLWIEGHTHRALHLGDTMTRPSHRGVGRGKTSILARTFQQYERQHAFRHFPFAWGFNTTVALRFGQLFLGYEAADTVAVRALRGDALTRALAAARTERSPRRFSVRRTRHVGWWADLVFRRARRSMGWQVARTREYLRWRYEDHPDFTYDFFVVSEWGIPCGWWLARREGNVIRLGDALFRSRSSGAPRAGLLALLRAFSTDPAAIQEVSGWFSRTPHWWNAALDQLEFAEEKEPAGLHFCVKTYASDVTPQDVADHFYFTLGDSDMF